MEDATGNGVHFSFCAGLWGAEMSIGGLSEMYGQLWPD
jgi:hypothetical protein